MKKVFNIHEAEDLAKEEMLYGECDESSIQMIFPWIFLCHFLNIAADGNCVEAEEYLPKQKISKKISLLICWFHNFLEEAEIFLSFVEDLVF